mgnify:CR=1 FL=1
MSMMHRLFYAFQNIHQASRSRNYSFVGLPFPSTGFSSEKKAVFCSALADLVDMRYGFYQFVRFAGLIVFAILAYHAHKKADRQK